MKLLLQGSYKRKCFGMPAKCFANCYYRDRNTGTLRKYLSSRETPLQKQIYRIKTGYQEACQQPYKVKFLNDK